MRLPCPPQARGCWLLCAALAGCTAELAGSGSPESPDDVGPQDASGQDASDQDAQQQGGAQDAAVVSDGSADLDAELDGALHDAGASRDADAPLDAAFDAAADAAQDAMADAAHDASEPDTGTTPDAGCTPPPVDIVWALDGSTSMLGEIAAFAGQIVPLLERLRAAGADVRMTVFAPFDPLTFTSATPGPNYRHVSADAQNENLLTVLLNLTPTIADRLRPNVRTDVLVASDYDAELDPLAFTGQLQSTLGHPFTFHAIAAPSSVFGVCNTAELAGAHYEQLARDTGGAFFSICTLDWPATFQQLGNAILADAQLCH